MYLKKYSRLFAIAFAVVGMGAFASIAFADGISPSTTVVGTPVNTSVTCSGGNAHSVTDIFTPSGTLADFADNGDGSSNYCMSSYFNLHVPGTSSGSYTVLVWDSTVYAPSGSGETLADITGTSGAVQQTYTFTVTGGGSDSSPLEVNTATSGFVAAIGTILVANIPIVIAILAALIGLGMLVMYVKRWIGRK